MAISELAGKKAPKSMLVNVPRLVSSYYTDEPIGPVAFGTSGHRGSSLKGTFNEKHIAATAQAICEYRMVRGISGPLFMGFDTHALSEPAFRTALEVFAGNGVDVVIHAKDEYTPTPVISHLILEHNRGKSKGLGDGVVILCRHRRHVALSVRNRAFYRCKHAGRIYRNFLILFSHLGCWHIITL